MRFFSLRIFNSLEEVDRLSAETASSRSRCSSVRAAMRFFITEDELNMSAM